LFAPPSIYMGVVLHAHPVCGAVPLPRGCFGGLSPPKWSSMPPPNWNVKHYILVKILSTFRMSSPPHKRKAPPQNRKAPLLKTFWRRFCRGESHIQRNASREVATLVGVGWNSWSGYTPSSFIKGHLPKPVKTEPQSGFASAFQTCIFGASVSPISRWKHQQNWDPL